MVRAAGSRSHTHTGWWLAGAVLLALAALLAWTARQNDALRLRVAVLERENQSLHRTLALRAGAPPPATPAASAVLATGPLPFPPPQGAAAGDRTAAAPTPPASLPRLGPLEEAFRRQREVVPSPGVSPFGRP